MLVYQEQNPSGLQEEDSDKVVENEDCVTQKSQMKGNDEKERMENPKVKIILILELQMRDKLLDNNYKSKELVLHNEMEIEELKELRMMTEVWEST